jgi:uncharacterized repeat protein (TIGR01451 family)
MFMSRVQLWSRLLVPAVLLSIVAISPRTAAGAPPRELESVPEVEVEAASLAAFDEALQTEDGRVQVIVELMDPPAAVVYAAALQGAPRTDAQARARAGEASRAQVLKIESAQAGVASALRGPQIDAREIFRVSKALNGIAVAIDRLAIREILKIPGVKRVLPIYPEYPTNATSVPFIGTPNVWANNLTPPLTAGALGGGISIGIIDSGVDYMHPDFGGTGAAAADYNTERAATVGFTLAGMFPTAKVVGGTDFAGDAYTGSNAPVPDVNPMDCGGHGSHVAGTAAGFGMTAGGATFTGPYDANPATYAPLLIGPGTAPMASLYALRVFGCFGATGLTVNAINWAMDPNNDADLSDHLDVINMSLGSNFGSAINGTSVASDNASLAGVIVVMSAGNAGDTFYINGSPGVSTRGISTAASVDSGVTAPFVRINSPGTLGPGYIGGAAAFGPALTPTGTTGNVVLSVDPTVLGGTCLASVPPGTTPGPLSTDACCPLTNAAAMAGNICLVDRGTCGFAVKAKNCQDAGAIATIVANNAPGSSPPGMAGVDPTIITPSVSITLIDGNALKAGLLSGPVNVTLLGPAGSDTLASFSSRGPRRIFGSPLRLKPDIAAPGLNITSVETGNVCLTQTSGAFTCTGVADPSGTQVANRSLTISGTSMASPHAAGIMALLRETHPDWSVEELKALVMNYAVNDVTLFAGATPPRFGPSRIGAGRVDPSKAAVADVVAMNAEDAGLVSLTFTPEVAGVVTQSKKVRIVNKGSTPQTYDLAFDNVVDSPGVSFSLPGGNSVTVPAGETVEIDVQMSANSNQMDHTRDAALFPTQGVQANFGDQPRNFLTEEGSYLTFSQSATLRFRLSVYMAERPASMMSAADTIVTGGAGTGSTTIALSGADLCTGTLAAGPTCTGTFPNDVESLVSPFELQVVSGVDPVNSTDYADIKYAGVSFLPNANGLGAGINNDLILFGVASWGDWSTLNEVAYNICVDTNEDGTYDRNVINVQPSIFVAGASPNDNFVRVIQDLTTGSFTILGLGSFVNLVSPATIDTALHLNNVMLLGATPAQLGMTAGDTTFRYKIVTCPGSSTCARTTGANNHCAPAAAARFDEAVGPFFYNWAAQGINFSGNFLDEDLNGNSLPVSWNTANMTTNGSVGALLLHHHNKSGTRAEVVLLDTAQRADLGITKTVDNPTPAAGGTVVFTITVTNNGPNTASGVMVFDSLPDGVTYVSDNGGGAYVPGTGVWTIPGSIANAASVSLQITATVDETEGIVNVAEITSGTPLDANTNNNRASVAVRAPRSADLTLTFGADVTTTNPGGTINYTLTVENNGQDPAYSVDVQEDYPAFPALNPGTFTASQGVYTPATGHWDLASLPVGQTATLQFAVTAPNMAGNLVNDASSSSALRFIADAADPNPSDNDGSVTVQVLSPSVISTLSKTVTGSFVEGGTVTYTVTIANTGPFDQQDNAASNEFVDVLPSQLTLVSATDGASPGTFSNVGNTVNWDGSIPAGGSVVITITATINAGTALQTVSNQGTVNHDNNGDGTNEAADVTDDPGQGGATDPTTFVVLSPGSIGTHSKTVTGTFQEGGTITYTVTLSNPSTSTQLDNPGDEFIDALPSTLTLTNATATSGTAVANTGTNTVTWNGTIAANGGTVTITITAIINTGTQNQTISNQGTANFDADGNGTNESSVLTDDPGTAAVDDPTSFVVGGVGEIPTLSEIGLAALALLLATGALLALRRRRA